MKIDIFTKPAALEFGTGADAFGLYLKRFTGADRMALLDAIDSFKFEAIQAAVEALIDGWKNVHDLEGRAIPFKAEGGRGSNLSAFIGSLPLGMQADVVMGVVEFVGVPARIRTQMQRAFRELGASIPPDPTAGPAGGGGGSASSESSASAT
jgi:hypothetical protein